MAKKYTHDELTDRVKSSGWGLTDTKAPPVTGTLEDVLKVAYQRREDNDLRGGIAELETAIELDMIQIEKLWRYLGLPV